MDDIEGLNKLYKSRSKWFYIRGTIIK
jgi:hypothetical protein